MATKFSVRVVQIEDIRYGNFVRVALDSDRVLHLAELIEGGVTLDPIKINSNNVIIDGRHRIEAYLLCGKKVIDAYMVDITDEVEMIAEAFKANTGGAMPPTQADIEHTVELLLEKNGTIKSIAECLSLPNSLVRKLINSVKLRLTRQKVQKAISAVADGGLTVAKAAEQYGVDVEQVKELMTSRRRKKNVGGVQEMKKNFTAMARSSAQKTARALRTLFDKYEDGDVMGRQVKDLLDQLDKLHKQSGRSLGGWRQRLEAKMGATKLKEAS